MIKHNFRKLRSHVVDKPKKHYRRNVVVAIRRTSRFQRSTKVKKAIYRSEKSEPPPRRVKKGSDNIEDNPEPSDTV